MDPFTAVGEYLDELGKGSGLKPLHEKLVHRLISQMQWSHPADLCRIRIEQGVRRGMPEFTGLPCVFAYSDKDASSDGATWSVRPFAVPLFEEFIDTDGSVLSSDGEMPEQITRDWARLYDLRTKQLRWYNGLVGAAYESGVIYTDDLEIPGYEGFTDKFDGDYEISGYGRLFIFAYVNYDKATRSGPLYPL